MMVTIGGGPAGLTASYQLAKANIRSIVLEADPVVGGIARTVQYKGFRFDIGGHRFFTKLPEVQRLWEDLLGDDFTECERLSRILYRGRWFDYPLRPVNALRGLGLVESLLVIASYSRAKIKPSPDETNFEQWVSNRFGKRLFNIFFKTYTEKVWGTPCHQISSDWAAQRIKNLSLGKAVLNAFAPAANEKVITSLIDRFQYPRHGPGMMWERCRDRIEAAGSSVLMQHRVRKVHHRHGRIEYVEAEDRRGAIHEIDGEHFIASMPLQDVALMLNPAAPPEIIEAARALRYRDFLIVVLIIDRADVFPDNWIYIHDPGVQIGRIQNFKNWSREMVPDPHKHTSLGLEYFVNENDALWNMPNDALIELGRAECARIRLIQPDEVSDGCVVRMKKAYPVYDSGYQQRISTLRGYLTQFDNLQMVGRNGQHRYNNQDHSMLTAMLAVENILGERHDIWSVNVDPEYHEQLDRAQPANVSLAAR